LDILTFRPIDTQNGVELTGTGTKNIS